MTVASPALSSGAARAPRLSGRDSTWLLWLAIVAVLLFLVVSPFVYLVVTSFSGEGTGAFTLENYAAAYGRERYVQALINSLELGAGAALLAGAFAIPLAWGVSRTTCRAALCAHAGTGTFITPPYTGLSPRSCWAGP